MTSWCAVKRVEISYLTRPWQTLNAFGRVGWSSISFGGILTQVFHRFMQIGTDSTFSKPWGPRQLPRWTTSQRQLRVSNSSHSTWPTRTRTTWPYIRAQSAKASWVCEAGTRPFSSTLDASSRGWRLLCTLGFVHEHNRTLVFVWSLFFGVTFVAFLSLYECVC